MTQAKAHSFLEQRGLHVHFPCLQFTSNQLGELPLPALWKLLTHKVKSKIHVVSCIASSMTAGASYMKHRHPRNLEGNRELAPPPSHHMY